MNLKTLSLIAATALIGVSGVQAQTTGAAAGGTSSNATAETAAKPSTPTTAKLTQGSGPTGSRARRMKRHRRAVRHHRALRHHRRHHMASDHMKKSGTVEKATPKPSSNGQ